MVFSSISSYLVDPSNWQQPQNHQLIGSSGGAANPFIHHPPPPPPPPHGSIRPGSMAERARLANIPMPDVALKCPRCDSTNTKFCYFNNYSLSQPRHFCKTCRRYWTRGGALRSVPVGGGCRRNKRSSSKSSSSKSPATTAAGADPTQQDNTSNNNNEDNNGLIPSSTTISNMNRSNGVGLGSLRSFMPPLSHITENFGGDLHLHHHHNIMGLGGASYLMSPAETGFQGFTGLIGGPVLAADMGSPNTEPWRLMQQLQNFPLFGSSEQPYQFQGGDLLNLTAAPHPIPCPRHKSSSSMLSQLAAGSVKMEDIIQTDLNLSRQLLGGNTVAGNEQWGTNPGSSSWTEFSGFSSSSTSNPL